MSSTCFGRRCRWSASALLFATIITSFGRTAVPTRADSTESHWRHPVAQVLSADGRYLFTANERSGGVSVIDTTDGRVVVEHSLGSALVDIRLLPENRLIAVDRDKSELILCRIHGSDLAVQHRLAVQTSPVDIEVSSDGRRAFVTSLWARRISRIEIPANGPLRVAAIQDTPFAPRCQLLLEDRGRLVVADGFGASLALFDAQSLDLLGVRGFPGHNIRGLVASSDRRMLVVSHQMLNELAHSIRGDVHWGLMMSNDLRWLQLDVVLDTARKIYDDSHMHPLGEPGSATSDPGKMAINGQGVVVVTLGGVGEVAIGKEDDFSLDRLKVGARPSSVVFNAAGDRAYVSNQFDDSITVIDVPNRKTLATWSLGDRPPLTLRDKGERLFFDGRLSHDSWMSCHSCHTDGHTNGMMNDNLSDDSFGAPKRVLSLLGKSGTEPLAWNGKVQDFSTQVRNSIEKTMQSDAPPSAAQVAALVAFVQSLPAPPPVDLARGERDLEAVARGEQIFRARKCVNCHAPPHYTTPKTYDVGIHDKQGNRRFNPPSLRGVGQRGPYFHDNRAATLRDVFETFKHRVQKEPLSPAELNDLLAFLRSL